MNNKKYESPEIQVISVEPNEELMDGVPGSSQGAEDE